MNQIYHTLCHLLSNEVLVHSNIEDHENIEEGCSFVAAVVSYQEKSVINQISLTLPTKETFLIDSHLLSQVYVQNESLCIPLTDTPYLDISLAQFSDIFMVQLGKYHILSQQRKLTPGQFYGRNSKHSIFSIFPRQELAFQYYDEQSQKQTLKIFSFEAPLTGKRKFLVSDITTFHQKYRCNVNRHVYEIIREGYPCRLYFDIEYCKVTNTEINGEFVVELWISLVLWKLYELYGIILPPRNIIHLDSSTEEKFSRHIIFLIFRNDKNLKRTHTDRSCLPPTSEYVEYLFHDNLEVGQFVLAVMSECLGDQEYSNPSEVQIVLPRQFQHRYVKPQYLKLWLFNSERNSRVFAIDLGVYTRNRAFRLLSSTKYGKLAKLEVQNSSQAKLLRIPSQGNVLIESSLTSSPENNDNWYIPTCQWHVEASHLNDTIKHESSCINKIISDCTKQFNFFLRVTKNSVRASQIAAEILERTLVIPIGVISSEKSSLPSSVKTLPLLKDLVDSTEYQDSPSSHYIKFCVDCSTPGLIPHDRCLLHGESNFTISPFYSLKTQGIHSPTNFSTICVHESFRSEFANIEEILSSKRISSAGHCQSPFSVFDDFVLHIASLNANSHLGPLRITQYSLRSVLPNNATNEIVCTHPVYLITYQISGTKYCHRIGRHHKSNHIMFEANLNQGYVVQKCWDPDCRGYKSPPYYLPHHSLPSMHDIQEVISDIILTNSLLHEERKT